MNKMPNMEDNFKQRLDYKTASPSAFNAILALSKYVHSTGLGPELLELIFMRVSQINGCAWCLDMHTKDAKAAGESDQRLFLLPVWREVPAYSDKERAALEWAEAVTLVAETHIPDDVYKIASEQFSEKELVDLTTAVIAINGWNRLNIAFKTPLVCDI